MKEQWDIFNIRSLFWEVNIDDNNKARGISLDTEVVDCMI